VFYSISVFEYDNSIHNKNNTRDTTQALPFTSDEGLALTLLANPPMDVGILIETCKKKTKHMIIMQKL
jgi:hypothetical protein